MLEICSGDGYKCGEVDLKCNRLEQGLRLPHKHTHKLDRHEI